MTTVYSPDCEFTGTAVLTMTATGLQVTVSATAIYDLNGQLGGHA
jgi:hypothetical protein